MLLQDCMMLSIDASPKLQRLLKQLMARMKGGAMGNGRAVRNLLEKAKRRQALRLQNVPGKKGKDDLCQLTAADFDERDLEALVVQNRPGVVPPARGQSEKM